MNKNIRNMGWEINQIRKKSFSPLTKNKLSPEAKAAHWKAVDATATSIEPMFKNAVKDFAKIQRQKLQEVFRKNASNGLTEAAASVRALDEVFVQKSDDKLLEKLTPCWAEAMKHGFEAAARVLGAGTTGTKAVPQNILDFNMYQPIFHAKIQSRGLDKAKNINATTKERLQKTLQEGIDAGESQRLLQERIKDEYVNLEGDEANNWRAGTIARTESFSSMNEGSLLTYAGEGVERKEWISTKDDKTRGADTKKTPDEFDHLNMDGQIVAIDEGFVESRSGETLMYPGDDEGTSAGNTINCRCVIAPVIGETDNIGEEE